MGYVAQEAKKSVRAVLVLGLGTADPPESTLLNGDKDVTNHRADALPWLLGQGYSIVNITGAASEGNKFDSNNPVPIVGGGTFLVILEKLEAP